MAWLIEKGMFTSLLIRFAKRVHRFAISEKVYLSMLAPLFFASCSLIWGVFGKSDGSIWVLVPSPLLNFDVPSSENIVASADLAAKVKEAEGVVLNGWFRVTVGGKQLDINCIQKDTFQNYYLSLPEKILEYDEIAIQIEIRCLSKKLLFKSTAKVNIDDCLERLLYFDMPDWFSYIRIFILIPDWEVNPLVAQD